MNQPPFFFFFFFFFLDSLSLSIFPMAQDKPTPDLMSSAKLLAGAAKSTVTNDGNPVDKAQVANATGDLLSAAKQYGHLDDSNYGKYIDKAEDYLHQYHSSDGGDNSDAQNGNSENDGKTGGGELVKKAEGLLKPDQSDGGGDGGGGTGELVKKAEGFLKSGESQGGGNGGGGGGELMKKAEGLLKPDQSQGGGDGGGGAGELLKKAAGAGELAKKAEGLLKPGQSDGGGGGGGGELIQIAEGFLKKN